jgi:hypothetical protein
MTAAQKRHRDRAGPQDFSHLGPGAKVTACLGIIAREAAEIDNLFQGPGCRCLCHVRGRPTVRLFKVTVARIHGVHQIKRRATAAAGLRQRG